MTEFEANGSAANNSIATAHRFASALYLALSDLGLSGSHRS